MTSAKALARAILPEFLFERLQSVRSRRLQVRLLKRAGLLEAASRYVEKNGCTVRYGPFAGMVYPRKAALNRHSVPKLLGTFEQELHKIISEIATRKYDLIVDIGSAEGYYAVGLARLLKTKVLAYDPEPAERALCAKAVQLNGIADLVELKDLFRPDDVHGFRDKRVLCICDCEGFEAQIFTPQTVPDTARWDVLIELHGNAARTLPALNWPQKTRLIESVRRTGSYPELDGLGEPEKLLSEYRAGPQQWLWCNNEA